MNCSAPIAMISTALLLTSVAFAQRGKNINPDHSLFEAVTGESANDEVNAWDRFYKGRDHAFGTEPISFLKEHLASIPKGKALVPAMGEGRNAIFLAQHGFTVEGVDISEVAVSKALKEARAKNLPLKTKVEDLNQFQFKANYYDLVVISFFYSKALIPKIKDSVKRGGYILVYNKLDIQDDRDSARNPGPEDFTVKSGELKEDFKNFTVKSYREYQDQGLRVAGILVKKP